MKLSDERLKEIRERCEKATPGPWHTARLVSGKKDGERFGWSIGHHDDDPIEARAISYAMGDFDGIIDKTDASFIAHARTDIPDLLEALKEARAELGELREMERWAEWASDKESLIPAHWRPLPLPPEEEK